MAFERNFTLSRDKRRLSYIPVSHKYVPSTRGEGKTGPQTVDGNAWIEAKNRREANMTAGGRLIYGYDESTGKPKFRDRSVSVDPNDQARLAAEYDKKMKARREAQVRDQANGRRLRIASALRRMGRDVSGFDVKSGKPLGDADYATLKKLVTVTDPDKLWSQRRSATFNSLWAEKRMADAKAAAEGRAGVRKAERGDGPITAPSGLAEAPAGTSASHDRPQGFWDDRPASRIQRGRVGDAPHYHDRDDSWRYAVNNTRGGAQAIQNRIDRGNWSLTGEGRLAMAMSQYNDRVNRNLARQVEGLNALADAGVDFSKWSDQNSEESV